MPWKHLKSPAYTNLAASMAVGLRSIATTLGRQKPARLQICCYSKFDVFGDSTFPADKQRFVPSSGTYPKGFLAGSINVGIKPASKSQPDLILVASEQPSCGAAVFTKNEFPAASVTATRDLVRKTRGVGLRGVIANSWCANTLTGTAGLEDAFSMSKEAAKHVSDTSGVEQESSMMVTHTGAGGERSVTLHQKNPSIRTPP